MSAAPEGYKFAESHEWAMLDHTGVVTVGISDHAQEALGDVVFIELPELGQEVSKGEAMGVVESVKAASDIYAPVSGEVVEINELLVDEPETVNANPYTDGWFIKIKAVETDELDDLMDADAYLEDLE